MSFEISEEYIKTIAVTFNIKKSSVELLNKLYSTEFKKRIAMEYLSHIVSAMEKFAREITKNPLFLIELKSTKKFKSIYSSKYSFGKFFTVYYPENLDPLQLRVGIAHELGHLFFLLISDNNNLNGDEPLCSTFSIIALADRCEFYKNQCKQFVHRSMENLIDTMSLLHNTQEKNHNISS